MASVQDQLCGDLEDALRLCDCDGALGRIRTLRHETRYQIHRFAGLDLQALHTVVSRYTDTKLIVDPNGSDGSDNFVVVSNHDAVLAATSADSKSLPAQDQIVQSPPQTWIQTWFTTRNVFAVLMAVLSLSNWLFDSQLTSGIVRFVYPQGTNSTMPANTTAKTQTAAPKTGFGIF